jgi:hypothetical protein
MKHQRPSGWAVILALCLLVAACAQSSPPQPVSAANAAKVAGADRQGHFARSADDLSTCVGLGSHERHPELHFDFYVSRPQAVTAKRYRSDEQAIWIAEFHEAGAGTDVFLRNTSATASQLSEVWRIVEICAAG